MAEPCALLGVILYTVVCAESVSEEMFAVTRVVAPYADIPTKRGGATHALALSPEI